MAWMVSVLALLCALGEAEGAQVGAPTGLMVDFKRSPSLGVRLKPSFTWIVPPCETGADHKQVAYQIAVTGPGGEKVWDSGKVSSPLSTYVEYGGTTALTAGTPFKWSVVTWTEGSSAPCESAPSAPGSFVTALSPSGFAPSVKWLSTPNKTATFGYFRKEITVPAGVESAQAFITSENADQDKLLSAYKLYVDGKLVNIGPGRGEAPVFGGDGDFRSLPYYTLDLSSEFGTAGTSVLAVEAMHQRGANVIMQLQLRTAGGKATTLGTDATWMAFDADVHRNPGPALHGHSAGTGFLEYIDARHEPVGWMKSGFKAGVGWAPAVAAAVSSTQLAQLAPKMQPPIEVEPPLSVVTIKSVAPNPAPAPPGPPPPVGPPATCVDVEEDREANIGCPAGEVISSIDFASFGSPTGSCSSGFHPSATCNSNHSMAVVTALCAGKASCKFPASCSTFHEQKSPATGAFCWDVEKKLAVKVTCKKKPSADVTASAVAAPPVPPCTPTGPRPCTPAGPSSAFLADFGKELTGGMSLEVKNGKAGQTVEVSCGESLSGDAVGSTWGWVQQWTLRDGAQTLTQHKYMECRFVQLTFSGTMALDGFTLTAWKTHYAWYEEDSHFASSNATLDAVWDLCRYTLDAASLDSYTDSNTRERTVYEADGIIAASNRLMVQRDLLWGRHSASYVIHHPTWPVEWKQITPFLLWQDYMASGTTDLAEAFEEEAYEKTMIGFKDSTGLLLTSKMGRHIVDWMPDAHETDETVSRGEYTASNYTSVSNGFAAHGLALLAHMTKNETVAAEGAALEAAIVKSMWNGSAFCDGPCSEVNGASKLMSSIFTLSFGMVPAANQESNWKTVADWGIEQIGDYGAFWFMNAVAGSYYADSTGHGETVYGFDDGTAIYTALTKCDEDSWCSGLRDDNLTMTRESWHSGTYSHEWGTSGIAGVVWGIMGIHQTAPAWANFTMKPKLGGLTHATITVPTLTGYINATATPTRLEVNVPCNSVAKLCLPRSTADTAQRIAKGAGLATSEDLQATPVHTELWLDGAKIESVVDGGHLCTHESVAVGCGASGAARVLSAR